MNSLKNIILILIIIVSTSYCCFSQINFQTNFGGGMSFGFSDITVYSSQINRETSSRNNQNLFNPSIQAYKMDEGRFAFNLTTGNINPTLLYETDRNIMSEYNFSTINAHGFSNKYYHRDIYNPYGSNISNGLIISGVNYMIFKILDK